MSALGAMTVVQVSDLDRSIAYYDSIGFTVTGIWGDPPGVAITRRGKVSIMLQLADQVHNAGGRWYVYVYVADVDTVFAELTDRGVETTGPPEDKYYGCRDFTVTDPDGHCLAFGTDLSTGDDNDN